MLFHAEVVRRNGKPVGYVRAASYGFTLGGAVGLAMIEGGRAGRRRRTSTRDVGGRDRGQALPGRRVAQAALRSRDEAHQELKNVLSCVRQSLHSIHGTHWSSWQVVTERPAAAT